MLILETSLNIELKYPFENRYAMDRLLFLDIETTGLSSNMSYLYLIGCIYFKSGKPILIQWFSEGIEEEKELLINFFTFISQYDVLIHYNGSGFDLPYILSKCKRYALPYTFDTFISLDIYKVILPYKRILALNSLKQRSIETYLNLNRKDPFTGGDLITIYCQYVGVRRYETLKSRGENIAYTINKTSGLPIISNQSSNALLSMLLLHNKEDLSGLLTISSMLAYDDLFRCNTNDITWEEYQDGLKISFNLPSCLPKKLNFKIIWHDYIHNDNRNSNPASISYCFSENTGEIYVTYITMELKHFLKDYKDYYYLPEEDMVMHKSIAEYVDKSHRKKATKSTAYLKKTGCFLPQTEVLFEPEFKKDYKDKLLWFEFQRNVLQDNLTMKKKVAYLKQLISMISSNI